MDTQRTKTIFSRLLASAMALLTLSTAAFAADSTWWNDAWTTRKQITIDTTAAAGNITEPIGGATVLLRFSEGNWPTGAKPDFSDLRFVADDDKTLLPFHIEKLNVDFLEAMVWVKLPDVKPNGKTTFWMYLISTDPKATKTEDVKGSFDADATLVFHFSETGAAANDATKNGNAADSAGGASEGSFIGSGVEFKGKDAVSIPAKPALLWVDNGPVTISAWVKVAVGKADAVILSRREGTKSFALGANGLIPYIEIDGKRAEAKDQPFTVGSWAHIAVVSEASKTTLYINGEQATAVGAGMSGMNTPITLGGDTQPGAVGFVGEMDELQTHKVARPAGWVMLAANGQSGEKGQNFIRIGNPEIKKDWLSWTKTGDFAVIINNLTHDGWAAIIILAIMFVVSWYVMFSKVRYLNGISKGNEIFMKQWRHVASDLTILDSDDAEASKSLGGRVTKENAKKLRKSSVYRIYHIGVEEIRHRMKSDREQGVRRGLAGRSIQAIRAALDGGLVRESQKINALIVLLTICISGGPFLGLLGTVIGVMTTFAGVAAAGEVNVTAIAPGIAAALLATVAGLAVAIPALFGYNYILSRVKDAKDDMHIFIDEFVTKMAEFYKEKGSND